MSTTTVTTTIATLPTPYPGGTLANLTYCSMAGVGLELDLYYPPSGFSPPYPLVVFVHGGGWISGDKVGVKDTAVYDMTKYGFIVGSVNYRLAPQYQFPAQIEDVKCAIRFLRANAAALWIDPGRIGAMGSSAGGHLVSLLGVTGSGTLWDVGEYTSVSSAVSAVMVLSGPENITMAVNDPAWINAVSSAFDDSYTLKLEGSPVNYPNGYSPPFLLEYGYNDTVVPYVQGVEFAGVMKSVGVNATLILVNNAGHVLVPVDPSIPEDPPLSTTRQDIVNFFIQRLGGGMMFSPGSLLPPGLEAGGLVVVALLAALLRRDVRN